MEIVSNLAFPAKMNIPWERLVRVCLIFLLSGMLYLSVQNHMASMEEEPRADIASAADIRSESRILKMDPVGIHKDAENIVGLLPGEAVGSFESLPVPYVKKDAGNNAALKKTETAESPVIVRAADTVKNDTPKAAKPEITVTSEITVTPVITAPDSKEIEITVKDSEENNAEVIEDEEKEIGVIKPITGGTEITSEAPGNSKVKVITPVIEETDSTETGAPVTGETDMKEGDPDYSEDKTAAGSTDISETETDSDIHEATVLSGFVLDAEGYITGVESDVDVTDGILVIPIDSGCVGIRKGALSDLGDSVYELYVPANIRDIEPDAFAGLVSLLYIEVAEENPCYYSMNGILYSAADEEVFDPFGEWD